MKVRLLVLLLFVVAFGCGDPGSDPAPDRIFTMEPGREFEFPTLCCVARGPTLQETDCERPPLPLLFRVKAEHGNSHCGTSFEATGEAIVIEFDHGRGERSTGSFEYALTDGFLYFSVDLDTYYEISGWYEIDDLGPNVGTSVMEVTLGEKEEEGTPEGLFGIVIVGGEDLDSTLLIVEPHGGDGFPYLVGYDSGLLLADRVYRLGIQVYLMANTARAAVPSPAVARGEVRIDFFTP